MLWSWVEENELELPILYGFLYVGVHTIAHLFFIHTIIIIMDFPLIITSEYLKDHWNWSDPQYDTYLWYAIVLTGSVMYFMIGFIHGKFSRKRWSNEW